MRVGQRVTPIDTIGCYIPGGRFSLVSTLLMTAIPAQVAGVSRIIVACPRPNAALLVAAEILGAAEIAHIGGAQAIAALAYGTRSVPRVDKIFGPGNRYVTAAKRLVSADCAIDHAGRAHRSADRRHATEMPATSRRICWPRPSTIPTPSPFWSPRRAHLPPRWRSAVAEQLSALPPTEIRRGASLAENGAILIAADTWQRGAVRQPLCARASEHSRRRGGASARSSMRRAVSSSVRGARNRLAITPAAPTTCCPRAAARDRAAGFLPGILCAAPACSRFRAPGCAACAPWWRRWPMPKVWSRTGAPWRCAQ